MKQIVFFVIFFLIPLWQLNAQTAKTSVISDSLNERQQSNTLIRLLDLAEKNYPLLKSKNLDVKVAEKGVNASKSSLIPSLDASYQVNFATYNNITGMAYSQFMVPISGPPSAENNYNGVFGSVTSLLMNWQPITFGQRNAQTEVSRAGVDYAGADARNEIFQHKTKVINAYLDLLTANELVKVQRNNTIRTEANLREVKSLVNSGIRPGVDTALFKAEISRARVELLNSQKYMDQARISLSQLLADDTIIACTDTLFFSRLPVSSVSADSVVHPLVSLYKTGVEMSLARKKVLSRTTMPVLGVWGTVFARGSGISYNNVVDPAEGLSFQRYNYGVGLQLSMPLLQIARIHPQLQQQDFLIQSNREKLNEVELQLKKQQELADTTINNALAIVKENYFFLESASFSYKAMESRYQSGLANFADLIQAQYALVKAEADNRLAFMSVWKAFLYKAAVNGDLNIFIRQLNQNRE
jgi:outer membrane protein